MRKTRIWLRVAFAASVAALSASGMACGGSDSTVQGKATGAPTAAQDRHVSHIMVPKHLPYHKDEVGCSTAIARSAPQRRTAWVIAKCHAPAGIAHVNISIGRYMPGHPVVKHPFVGYTQHPRVIQAGVFRRYGRCAGRSEVVTCDARIKGTAKLEAGIELGSEACASGVSVVAVSDRTCPNRACAGAVTLNGLFHAKPEGCGSRQG